MLKKHESGAWVTDTDTVKDVLITRAGYDIAGWREVVYEEDALAYAEEQARKARREALEEAFDIVNDYNVEPMCPKRILELMDTRRDGE